MAYLDRVNRIARGMMPNVRESLDDCHMRYYKYDQSIAEDSLPLVERQRQPVREFPHMAAIGWTGTDNTIKWSSTCAGSLVWESFVLTSAHCTVNENGLAPDVVRLGDVDFGDEQDNQYAQQLKIAEVIRHPDYSRAERAHDIALLRLAENVTLGAAVVPACLWKQDEVNFRALEASGWLATGFSEQQTFPKESKVTVRPAPNACNETAPTGDAGPSNLLCVIGDEAPHCLDNGAALLQIRLQHNSLMTPFIVGIGGSPLNDVCSPSSPALYTKVSDYVLWIESTLTARGESAWYWKFQPAECALRYAYLRPYIPEVVLDRTESIERVAPERALINQEYSPTVVEINFGTFRNHQNCYGVIVDEYTVLTLAQCTTQYGKRAKYVEYLRNERNTVVNHFNHPGYREGQYRNDIGILKVRDRFQFSNRFAPFCIWHEPAIPSDRVQVTGFGRQDLNFFSNLAKPVDVFSPMTAQLLVRTTVLPPANCSYSRESGVGLPDGLSAEHLCYGHSAYLVPGTCTQGNGSAIGGLIKRLDRSFRYAYALTSHGQGCGFGSAAIGVRLAHHVNWIRTILLPGYRKDSGSVHFINSDLEQGDTCRHVDGASGTCVDASRCPVIQYAFARNFQIVFCNSGSIVCCPYENIVNETSAAGRELDECAAVHYRADSNHSAGDWFRSGPSKDDLPFLVQIGSLTPEGEPRWGCRGTIVSSTVVVTGYGCLMNHGVPPTIVRLGMNETIAVKEVIHHPEYSNDTKRFDVALVKLSTPIDIASSRRYPACIWTNQTHTPFTMVQTVIDENENSYAYPTAKYSADCSWSTGELSSAQLCVDMHPEGTTVSSGDPLYWSEVRDDGSSIPYLVGLMSYGSPEEGSFYVYTRMAAVVGWIKSML
ncbi:uncharacterized protein LOC128272252 [Anopheles cruzii]|uniref:uncharacterized protein LOC128272252 n=1 Tax=Anopheles cruzii TaxID=68878 RepID=UPI0022EC66BC|nr:uncharacterized protein LOC128272252 [Anopheles cruzii]